MQLSRVIYTESSLRDLRIATYKATPLNKTCTALNRFLPRRSRFLTTEVPSAAREVTIAVNSAERIHSEGRIAINISWMHIPYFNQFDIDSYDISVISTSGVQQLKTCGECTSVVITVSENPNNVQMGTRFNITIAPRSRCGMTGPAASYGIIVSKLLSLLYYHMYVLALFPDIPRFLFHGSGRARKMGKAWEHLSHERRLVDARSTYGGRGPRSNNGLDFIIERSNDSQDS